ncbi:MAG TPA: delta-lactam-biosynthetic de-N-acetylase [Clostridiaceae bacterium]|jgi:peptidoglycan-N-acetylmuramic acid deacetylase|nr:delta-lactam-biosynthetic de-N-acetylase [Clostridiaceae bacterium]
MQKGGFFVHKMRIIAPVILLLTILSFPLILHFNRTKKEYAVYVNEIETGNSIMVNGNMVYRWGLKRNKDGKPPEVGTKEVTMLHKYGGKYIGDTSEKKIYLTFDEGYEQGYTEKILNVLRDNDVKAVFFVTGPYLDKNPELIRRMVEEGHEVGNHTVNHYSLPTKSATIVEKEILELDRVFYEKYGKHMRMLRPPRGEYDEKTLKIAKDLNHTCILWSFAYRDWLVDKQKGADHAYKMIMDHVHNGAVLLLHAVSKDNADALDRVIKDIKQQGYTFGTPDELMNVSVGR